MSIDYIFDIGVDDFEEKVLSQSHSKPVLIDFWASWCLPCLSITPNLKEAIKYYDGNIVLTKLEVDDGENMKLAGKYKIRGFPTIILFEKGLEINRFSGMQSTDSIKSFIKENIQLIMSC